MTDPDYYRTLGVARGCDADALKKAYRKMAVKWHPDKNPGNQSHATERFKVIAEAYAVLSDPEKRRVYDKYGHEGLSGGGGGGGGGGGRGRGGDDFADDFEFGTGGSFGGFGEPFSSRSTHRSSGRARTSGHGHDHAGFHRSPFSFGDADRLFRAFFGGRDPFAEVFEEMDAMHGMMFGGGGLGGHHSSRRRGRGDELGAFGGFGGGSLLGGMMGGGFGDMMSGMHMASSSLMSSGGHGRGVSNSVSEQTSVKNGIRTTVRTTTVRHADGSTETKTETVTEDVGGGRGASRGFLGDDHGFRRHGSGRALDVHHGGGHRSRRSRDATRWDVEPAPAPAAGARAHFKYHGTGGHGNVPAPGGFGAARRWDTGGDNGGIGGIGGGGGSGSGGGGGGGSVPISGGEPRPARAARVAAGKSMERSARAAAERWGTEF